MSRICLFSPPINIKIWLITLCKVQPELVSGGRNKKHFPFDLGMQQQNERETGNEGTLHSHSLLAAGIRSKMPVGA